VLKEITSLKLFNQNLTFFNSNKNFDVKLLRKLYFLNLQQNFLSKLDGIVLLSNLVHLDVSNNFLKK
jgi:hypothetical protein